ncbi:MAG TPA: pirin family protein [Rhodanobacteraceae bacterium]|jgi:redox-sensitive bicupin YhaK (pirin superfamily)|nr:pirin family protein [Rhodanobacteraceae bacterium]
MNAIRSAAERGQSRLGWLDSRHTFSFSNYHDPAHMGFGALRVINEDRVQPGKGFGTHSHRDMEILSWVLEGALEHSDSMGTHGMIRPGELQRMSAGTGVTHSEFNASKTDPVHFLQIWLFPEREGIAPSYEQRAFAPADLEDRLHLVASHDGRDESVKVHQDADLYAGRISPNASVSFHPDAGRSLWLQVAKGQVQVEGRDLHAGDAASWTRTPEALDIRADTPSEVLLFDLAPAHH